MKAEFRIFGYLKRAKGNIVLLFLIALVSSAALYTIPWLYRLGFDEYLPTRDDAVMLKLILVVVGISAARLVTGYLFQRVGLALRFKMRRALRFDLMRSVLESAYAYFTEHAGGEIVNQLIPEADMAADLLEKICEAAFYGFQIVLFFILLLAIDFWLGMIYLAVFAVALALMLVVKRRMEACQLRLSGVRDRFFGFYHSFFASIKELKCYRLLPFQKELLGGIMIEEGRQNASLARNRSLLDLSASLPGLLGGIILFVWGFYKLATGDFTYGSLLTLLSLINILCMPMTDFGVAVSVVQNNRPVLGRISRLLDNQREPQTGAETPPVSVGIGLRDLSFSYRPGKMILRGVEIDFPTNGFIALVGESGSGKTTLINLLLKLYAVPDGKIFIDGRDVNGLRTNGLRERVGVVSQEGFVFNASLKKNIDVGGRLSDAEVLALCREVELSELVARLPGGIHSRIAENGMNLSGGERQRLTLARCLAKKADVIILDEATSALDFNTEKKIVDILLALKRARSPFLILAITHRPSFARRADWVCLLERGEIVEAGTHAELVARRARYYALFEGGAR